MLLTAWGHTQTSGAFRIRAPELHDNVEGIKFVTNPDIIQPQLPYSVLQRLLPQIDLTFEAQGSGVAGDIETGALLIYYENLPGIDARLISEEDLKSRAVNVLSVENNITNGTAGGYSGEEAFNAEFDLLKANTDYAILGATADNPQAVLRYRGVDSGNLGIGLPLGEAIPDITKEFFVHMARLTGLNTIPVFNSANVDALLLDVAGNENAQATRIATFLAELST
jgi:hypothetical protein